MAVFRIERTRDYTVTVSYTHLDVYKRQTVDCARGLVRAMP